MKHISVLFNWADSLGYGETPDNGVENIENRTRERLLALLGDVRNNLWAVAWAVALTLSANAYASDGQQLTQIPDNGVPVVLAVVQENNPWLVTSNKIVTSDTWTTTSLIAWSWKSPENKDKVRIQPELLVTILSKPTPPKTTEALEVLINLPAEHQAILLWEKPIGDMETNYLFGVSKDLYTAVNVSKKWTLLPSVKEVQHFLKWVTLAKRVATLLKDDTITVFNLAEVEDDRIIESWNDGIAIMDDLAAYATEDWLIATEKYVTAETRAATAETRAATVETRAATVETRAATAETRAATAETRAATAEERRRMSSAMAELFKEIKL
jgi:hypothetical protein